MNLKDLKKINTFDKFKNDKFYLVNNKFPIQTDCSDLTLLIDELKNLYNINVHSFKEISKNDYYYLLSREKKLNIYYYEQ